MERERIITVLEEVYREDISGDPEDSFASLLDEFSTTGDPDLPVYWISETIIETVERLAGRRFGWHAEALRNDFNLSGEFLFIMVDPKTKKCLTAEVTEDGYCTVGVILAICSIQEAVDAVRYFLKLASKQEVSEYA